ncbi:hypothetical protein PVAND_013898 [Polypedilum vanderplanki]|uniref:Ribokinase n=1 Tax=Polypedilum vanderplanki TaxID=319348 RepID=A0A9J6CR37_POLVA|nr:hypothetical protein PVAND_013898 [Polypedilum vanderplanki]
MFDVLVFGSCMIDFISYVNRMPKSGETIHSQGYEVGFGGKGANQAIASARLGCKTAMIGKIGNDGYGKKYKEHFEKEGINTDFLESEGEHSGVALIIVNSIDGNNQIVINANANKYMSADICEKAKNIFEQSKILICQLEIPLDATIKALKMFNGLSILNAAPALENLPNIAYKLPNIFCVNELEAEELTKITFNKVEDAKQIIQSLIREKGCKIVIMTLGKYGAALNIEEESDKKIYHVPVPSKNNLVVDTTGAGDCFIAALAYFYSKYPKASLLQKVAASISIATHSVQYKGTQSSYINFPNIDPLTEKFEHHEL